MGDTSSLKKNEKSAKNIHPSYTYFRRTNQIQLSTQIKLNATKYKMMEELKPNQERQISHTVCILQGVGQKDGL